MELFPELYVRKVRPFQKFIESRLHHTWTYFWT